MTAKNKPSPCSGCPLAPTEATKPKPKKVVKTDLEIGKDAVFDFVKRGMNFFGI